MKNAYIASVNPMHFSHWNTLKEAEKRLKEEVFLCIGQSALKDNGLFSLEERAYIAHHFYGVPKNKILLLSNKEIILETIRNATNIIRGIRSEKDLTELQRLVEHYGVKEDLTKLFPIEVPEQLKDISSSRLIERIKLGQYKEEDGWIPIELISLIRTKLNT